jgi:catechol 2,3-dioxygenase-like lactoylglutathione lyase family enzyme
LDHVGVVVDDLEAAIAFFVELGMEVDGGASPVEGDWVNRVVGLDEVRVEIAFVRTPDGYGRLELTKFHNPTATTAEPNAPANTFGLRRLMFAVDDIDDVVARMRAHGAELVGRSRTTRISIGSATSAAPLASSSRSPNSSAEPSVASSGGADDAISTDLSYADEGANATAAPHAEIRRI